MVALAIIGLVAVVLLDRRVKAVQDAQKIKDQRLGWTLAAWKMSDLELDDELLKSEAAAVADAGTFADYADEYATYTWEYEAKREEVKAYDETEVVEKPREVLRVTLRVKRPESPEPLVELQAILRPKDPQEAPAGGSVPPPENPK